MKGTVRILVLLTSVLGYLNAGAQNNSSIIQYRTHIFHMGIVMGRDFSDFTTSKGDFTQGSTAGIEFTYRHRRKHVSVMMEALYSSRGTEWGYVADGQYGETYHWKHYEQLKYVEMPVKFVYVFFSDSTARFRPKISVGPSFGYLATAKHVARYEIPEWFTSSEPVITDVRSDYNDFDIGATGSIGFNWEFRQRRWLTFEAGYTYGLMDINNNPSVKQSFMNRDIYLVAGLEVPIIKQHFR